MSFIKDWNLLKFKPFSGKLATGELCYVDENPKDFLETFNTLLHEPKYTPFSDEDKIILFRLQTEGDARIWMNSLEEKFKEDWAVFQFKFLEDWQPQVECWERRVRSTLKLTDWHQARGEELRTYNMRFSRLMAQTQTMAQYDRVDWYLTGMQPHLRKVCMVDTSNKHWSELQPLMAYALGQELRFSLLDAARGSNDRRAKPTVAAAAPAPKRPQTAVERREKNGKKRKADQQSQQPQKRNQAPRTADWMSQCKKAQRCLRCGSKQHRVAQCTMPAMAAQPAGFPTAE